jgi:hypothetical protein
VASPSMMVRLGMGVGARVKPDGAIIAASLAGERTRPMTAWWCARRAGKEAAA